MSCFTEQEVFFCDRISKLALCNHFSEERLPLIRELLERDYCDSGDRWHWQWQSNAAEDRNIKALADLSTAPRPTLIVTHAGVVRAAAAKGITADSFQTQIEFGGILRLAEQERRPDE